jgi:hypothetical protein
MQQLTAFKRWARENSPRRGIICHFYIAEKSKPYYGNIDFAFFNFASKSREWIIGGTEGHGVISKRGKRSKESCLNCFEVDDTFFKAMSELNPDDNDKFEIGLLLNKRKLRNKFEVIDVEFKRPGGSPALSECHKYDNPRYRAGVLKPFNFCNVVRIVIPKSQPMRKPITPIPYEAIMAILTKQCDYNFVIKCLKLKRMTSTEVFPLL